MRILLLALMGCATDATSVAGLSTVDEGATIEIGDAWRSCETVDDCTLVSISCDDCCQEDAIAASRASEWPDAFQDVCDGYEGGICDCAPREYDLYCTQGRCEARNADE